MEIWISIEAQTLHESQDRVLVRLPVLHEPGSEATVLIVVIGVKPPLNKCTEQVPNGGRRWTRLAQRNNGVCEMSGSVGREHVAIKHHRRASESISGSCRTL